jgi:hypothetical protein
MRLRIGVSLPFAPNALVYAKDLNITQTAIAKRVIADLAGIGIVSGMIVGWGKLVLTVG